MGKIKNVMRLFGKSKIFKAQSNEQAEWPFWTPLLQRQMHEELC